MDKAALNRPQAPNTPHAVFDGASTGSNAGESVARLLELMTELKGDIGARLNRLEAGQARNDQASVASSRSSTFQLTRKRARDKDAA